MKKKIHRPVAFEQQLNDNNNNNDNNSIEGRVGIASIPSILESIPTTRRGAVERMPDLSGILGIPRVPSWLERESLAS